MIAAIDAAGDRARWLLRCWAALVGVAVILVAAVAAAPDPKVNDPKATDPKVNDANSKDTTCESVASKSILVPVDIAALPNAYRWHPDVISGGLPAGEAGFAALRDLGVQTIISVDGDRPDLELARKYALRYVHLPHGYDDIPAQRAVQLSSAVRRSAGPVYIHCHHGLHRSPAAAAVACIGAGLIEPDQGPIGLQIAGTSGQYQGLYAAAQRARRIDDAALSDPRVDLPQVTTVAPLTAAMVDIDQRFERLHQIDAAGWTTSAGGIDPDAAHQALLLRQCYTELLRPDRIEPRGDDFQRLLQRGERLADRLHRQLQDVSPIEPAEDARELSSQTLLQLKQNCQQCHRIHR